MKRYQLRSIRGALLATVTVLAVAGVTQAGVLPRTPPPQLLEGAAEVEELKFSLDADGRGLIYARECDQCKIERLSIRAETKFFLKDAPLAKSSVARYHGRGATVFFDAKTKIVSRIVYW